MINRYVITGMGQISSMGNSMDELKHAFKGDDVNFSLINNECTTCLASKVNHFDFYEYGFKNKTYTDRASQLCTYTVNQLVKNFSNDCIEPHRKGLITSSYFGCLDSASKYLQQLKTFRKAKFASPLFFTHSICNIPNSIATTECELKGISNHLVGASDSGLMTLWQAIQSIETHQADYVIAGAFDALSDELFKFLNRFRLINKGTNINDIKGPFDAERKHPVWGEAAAFLSVEKRDAALKRPGKILGEIKGIGLATSYKNKTESIKKAMKMAIERSEVSPKDIAFVVSNANGTIASDRKESNAIRDILGCDIPVFAPKSYFGETFAASGVLGIISVLSMVGEKLPFNRYLNEVGDDIGIKVKYDQATIKNDDLFIVNGYNRGGTSISVCIAVYRGD